MTPRRFRIAFAARSDVADLHALIRGLADYERLTEMCVSTPADLEAALFGPRSCAEALIARADAETGLAAGFALFFHTFSTFRGRPGLWLEDLFVRPECRGEGLGRALLRELAGIARDRGCARFEWAVLDWNAPAIAFYERQGAVVLPEWRIARVTGPALDTLAARRSEAAAYPSSPPRPSGSPRSARRSR